MAHKMESGTFWWTEISKVAHFEMGQSGPKLARVAQKSAQRPKIAAGWPILTKWWPKTASGGPKWATNDGPNPYLKVTNGKMPNYL